MSKKILIHTLFYKNYNYGGMLQAYALYHKLSTLGYECEELNYNQQMSGVLKKLIYRGHRLVEIIRDPAYYKNAKKKVYIDKLARKKYVSEYSDILRKVFEIFMEKEFVSTKVYTPDTIKKLHGYDFYISGGDQVWNPEWTDRNFFFCGIEDGKKIGYSCSAGKSKFTNADTMKICKFANNMDVISVREKNLSEILNQENIKNQIIADPVFLLTKDEWIQFANDKYNLPEHYVFAYLLGDDPERRRNIRKFAEKNNLKIVSIPHVLRYYIEADEEFADLKIRDAGPKEFVSLIKNADFVVTDSFHGTAFSILFEKQFINFSRFKADDKRSLNARLKNIVEEYGIDNRLILVNDIENIMINQCEEIDYTVCRKITEEKRKKALDFLKKAL